MEAKSQEECRAPDRRTGVACQAVPYLQRIIDGRKAEESRERDGEYHGGNGRLVDVFRTEWHARAFIMSSTHEGSSRLLTEQLI